MLRFDVLDRTATAGPANRPGRTAPRTGRPSRRAFVGLILAAVASAHCQQARAIDGWSDQPQAAFEAARESGRPILVLFTGSDWCPHCQLLEEHVLATDAFRAWARGRVELLVIDMPRQGITTAVREERSAVCKRYGVKSFPTVMLIAPDGMKIAAQPGYSRQSAEAWITSIDRKLGAWSAVAAAEPAAAPPAATPVASSDNRVQETVRDAVKEAESAKRPILLVVSRASDQDGRIRAAKLVNDPEFRSFAKDTFVVAEIAADDATEADADAEPAPPTTEPLRSLLGGVSLPADEVEVIVTYDGRTPMYTQSARQPTPRLISGLRRFLGARPTVRR
jgi:thioredoxin-related protein